MTEDVIARARRTTTRRLTAASVVVAALMLAAAVVVFVTREKATPALSPVPAPHAAPGGVEADLSADLRWVDVAGVVVPVSALCGPFDASSGLARGFSHDRGGAVLAAVHIVARVAPQVGADIFHPTFDAQVVGPDAAAMRARVAQEYDELRGPARARYGGPVGDLHAALRGYRITAYEPGEAAVELLTESATDAGRRVLAASAVRVSWTGSDWALIAPAGGSFDGSVWLVTDVSGFTVFPGGR
ncbi:hypothetical protein ACIBMZ_26625 [Micromonospora sp. NPDC049900]|uniref:hypothetical protein n=1 Tax=Micromonospora sp. NPDC049900 TaxID=3364275 RepID=UPI0037BC482F